MKDKEENYKQDQREEEMERKGQGERFWSRVRVQNGGGRDERGCR